MKKRQVDHVLRAAGEIVGDDQFVIIGSQSLHGRHPDVVDETPVPAEHRVRIKRFIEADLGRRRT